VPALRRSTLLFQAGAASLWRLPPREGTILVKATLMVLSLLALTSAVMACTCIDPGLPTHVRQAADVFVAKVLSVRRSARVAVPKGEVASVVVIESWKGVRSGQRLDIATGSGGGDCGYEFEGKLLRGDSLHLIFARTVPKKRAMLTTDICSGSRPLRWAAAERDSLNRWKALGLIPG
jgi:hypothetical protein